MSTLADRIRKTAESLIGSPSDYDSLMDTVGDARFVLLGEASHGTHEFYVLHFDHTRAVEPLERCAAWQTGEVEETFPSGI
jgi:erythromycin esterase-like protein